MKLVFTPDIDKFEEEFCLEGNSIKEIIEKLKEECPVNCDFCVGEIIGPYAKQYVGIIRLEEDCEPKWLNKTNRKKYQYD